MKEGKFNVRKHLNTGFGELGDCGAQMDGACLGMLKEKANAWLVPARCAAGGPRGSGLLPS